MKNIVLFIKLGFILFNILFLLSSNNQFKKENIISNSLYSLENLNHGVLEITTYYKDVFSSDTIIDKGILYFKRTENNENIIFRLVSDSLSYETLFDGENVYFIYHNSKKTYVKNVNNIESLQGNAVYRFLDYFTYFPIVLNQLLKNHPLNTKEFLLDKDYYKLTFEFSEDSINSDLTDISIMLIIDKKNLLPVKISGTSKLKEFDNEFYFYSYEINLIDTKLNEINQWLNINNYDYPMLSILDNKQQPELLTIGTDAVNWKLKSLNKDSISLFQFNDKYVLMHFWYLSCLPCLKSLPYNQQLYESNKDILEVIGLNTVDNDVNILKKYLNSQNINYPIVYNAKETSNIYNVFSFPTYYLINPQKQIIYYSIGFTGNIINEIDSVLNIHINK